MYLEVNNDPEKTREEILSLIAHHVTAVNYIYRDTKFDGRVEHRNIKFEVQRIKVPRLQHNRHFIVIILMQSYISWFKDEWLHSHCIN
jgi:hypothetical protein